MMLTLIFLWVAPCVSRAYASSALNSELSFLIGSMLVKPNERKLASRGLMGFPLSSAGMVDEISLDAIS